jgi:hypothetical protein
MSDLTTAPAEAPAEATAPVAVLAQSAAAPPLSPVHQDATECIISPKRENSPLQLNTTAPALTQKQLAALDLLAAGESDSVVSFRLKIHRTTLYRWKYHNPAFIVELNRRHQELWSDFAAELRLGVARAIGVVRRQLGSVNDVTQLRAARLMINLVNTDRISPKNAPTRVDDVLNNFLRAAQPLTLKEAPAAPTFTDAQRQALLERLLADEDAANAEQEAQRAAARSKRALQSTLGQSAGSASAPSAAPDPAIESQPSTPI